MPAPPDPFAFVIDGPPISSQTRRKVVKHAWTANVRQTAAAAWPAWPAGAPPYAGPVSVEILYLHDPPDPRNPKPLDVDNLAKPILDGLKGVVYTDDAVVLLLEVHKRDRSLTPVSASDRPLYDARIGADPQFLHVAVRPLPNPLTIP